MKIHRLFNLISFSLILFPSMISAGLIRGQVTDDDSKLPIEGVQVSLDEAPFDGDPETTIQTDAFGFYDLSDLSSGDVRVTFTHPAYTSFSQDFTIVQGATETLSPMLERKVGYEAFLDLYVQVLGVTSGLALETVPVKVERFEQSGDTVPIETTVVETDASGAVIARGLLPGFYRFSVNVAGDAISGSQPNWESYQTVGTADDKKWLDQAYALNVLLKPIVRNMTLRVIGFDPTTLEDGVALKNFTVELTGVEKIIDAAGTEVWQPVIPTRTAVTGDDGKVTFTLLPSITYQAVLKRLGWDQTQHIIDPADFGGNLPGASAAAAYDVESSLHITHCFVTAVYPPYTNEDLFNIVNFRLEGIDGTETEGVIRIIPFYNVEGFRASRIFQFLIPGRYRVSVASQGSSVNGVVPYFYGSKLIDITLGDPVYGGFQSKEITLPLEVSKATVRGRLFLGVEEGLGQDGFLRSTPRYEPAANVQVQFVEKIGDDLLPPELRIVTVETNERGEFAVELFPSRYGVRVLGLPDYTPENFRLRNFTTTISNEKDMERTWAYPERELNDLQGVFHLRSNQDYSLDLHVNKQLYGVHGTVRQGVTPVPYDLVTSGGQVILEDADGLKPSITAPLEAVAENVASFRLRNVPPGNWNLRAENTRYSFTYNGSNDPFLISFPASTPPDVNPPEGQPFRSTFHFETREIDAEYDSPDTTLRYRLHRWDGVEYQESGPFNIPSPRAQADYAGKRRGSGIPQGAFTFWVFIQNVSVTGFYTDRVTGTGEMIFDIFAGGPSNNLIDELPPIESDWTIRVRNEDDPSQVIESDTSMRIEPFRLPDENITVSGGSRNFPTWTGRLDVFVVQNDNWQFVRKETKLVNPATPSYETTVYLRRATRFEGTIASDDPVPQTVSEATVQIHDRSGMPLSATLTEEDGDYTVAQVTTAAPIYMDVRAPGYIPKRERRTTSETIADPQDPANRVLEYDAFLTPLPLPEVTEATLDRFGLFLPGVNKSGTEEAGGFFVAEGPLTMNWMLRAQMQNYDDERPDFDDSSGAPIPVDESIEDPIIAIWIIDPREYFGSPVNSDPVAIPLPAEDNVAAKAKFLDDIENGEFANVFFQKITTFEQVESEFTARGEVPLWELPTGPFNPVFAIETRSGAIKLHEHVYEKPADQLEGVKQSPWLAFVTDLAGTVAGVNETRKAIEDLNNPALTGQSLDVATILPGGRFIARPDFLVMITEENGFLNYRYEFLVSAEENQDSPSSGLLGFGPGVTGLQLLARAIAEVKGQDKKINFTVEGSATTTEDIEVDRYLPSKFLGLELDKPVIRPTIGLETTFSNILNEQNPLESQLTHETTGVIQASVRANLKPITSKIPYAGPVLLALDRKGALQIFATADAAVSLRARTSWNTLRPRMFESNSVTNDHRLRRHFLGGNEDISPPAERENLFEVGFNFGLGMEIEAGRLSATGRVALQGEERRFPGLPEPIAIATIEVNPDGDWPYLKKIQGSINLSVGGKADLGIFEFEKNYSWDALTFSHEFGTETVFQLAPMVITQSRRSLAGEPPATFDGRVPEVIRGLSSFARHVFVSGSNTDALLFTDVTPNGEMSLFISLPGNEGEWGTPVQVAGPVAAISHLALAELPDGSWLATWAELGTAALTDPFAPTTIRSSIGNAAGSSWSAPTTVTTRSSIVDRLELLVDGDTTGLLFSEAEDGPFSTDLRLLGSSLSSGVWSAPVELLAFGELTSVEVKSLGVAATGASPIAWIDGVGALKVGNWNGGALMDVTTVAPLATGQIAMTVDDAGTCYLAYSAPGSGIAWSMLPDGGSWTEPGTIVSSVVAQELVLTDLAGSFMIAWISAGSEGDLAYAFVDPAGDLLVEGRSLTENRAGQYRDLALLPNASGTSASLTFRYRGSTDAIRVIEVSQNEGIVNNDRDEDGFNDIFELRLLDELGRASSASIDDVSPFGDENGNNIPDIFEYALALDPLLRDQGAILTLSLSEEMVGGERFMTLTYTRRKDATNVEYVIEASGDLVNWDELDPVDDQPVAEIINQTDNGDGTETITVRDRTATSAGEHRFLRLLIRLAN